MEKGLADLEGEREIDGGGKRKQKEERKKKKR